MLTPVQNEPPASQATTTGDRRSVSPDASSLFDVSGMNTSQDTTITEPDIEAPITATAAAPTAPVAPAAVPTPSLSNTLTSQPPPPPQSRWISSREELKQVWLTLPMYLFEHCVERACSLSNARAHLRQLLTRHCRRPKSSN